MNEKQMQQQQHQQQSTISVKIILLINEISNFVRKQFLQKNAG